MPKKCTYNDLQTLRDVQSLKRTRASQNKTDKARVTWVPGSWHSFSLQSVSTEPLLVNIHIVILKEAEIQPGENSQSISAISLGLHLKALSQIAEMIHCTWLYIIMAAVIMH